MDWSWSTIYLITEWLIRIGTLVYVPQRRTPNAARAWLLLIFFLPIPGILLYAWVGRVYVSKKRIELLEKAAIYIHKAEKELAQNKPDSLKPYKAANARTQNQIKLVTGLCEFPAIDQNHIEILYGYEDLHNSLLEDIENAQKSIHMLYYIYSDDATSQRFTDALCAASQRGVKVRLLLDAVGAYKGLKKHTDQLTAAGVEVYKALPVKLFQVNTARMDLRNHRKIAVIDGAIAHMGSQNIVDASFVPGFPNEELNLRIKGLVVCELQAVFLADWYIETHQHIPNEEIPELFRLARLPPGMPNHVAQLVPSGPGYGQGIIRDVMMSLIYDAQKSFCIVTPYFVPDEPFLTALLIAARRGVKVQLIFPDKSNHLITNLVQESYYHQMLKEGIEIYRYKPAMVHAKYIVFDENVAMVGSPNIDVRSFILNAEVSMAIYDKPLVKKLRTIQEDCIQNSIQVDLESWQKRPKLQKISANLARLADALL